MRQVFEVVVAAVFVLVLLGIGAPNAAGPQLPVSGETGVHTASHNITASISSVAIPSPDECISTSCHLQTAIARQLPDKMIPSSDDGRYARGYPTTSRGKSIMLEVDPPVPRSDA
ncbi:MAG: hypothetical protein NXI32_31310 [bacterium]|nr:hypothetical protein [bacterium]